MALDQDIVIVNEFSVPGVGKSTRGGKSGTRGSTPGAYVLGYMGRKGATEPLAPIRRVNHEAFIRRYMAREDAVERLRDADFPALEQELARTQGQGGVAFGYGSFSLSEESLSHAAADIQRLFDDGHTVLKTVLSFDEDYLRRHNLLPEGFRSVRPGDARGHLDQLKLRLAIMRGLDRMGQAHYDDLRFVGVIQVDTRHVHAHLAMVDAGVGARAADGTQKGKIGSLAKSLLRRGIDAYLDEKQHVAHLSSAVRYEQRNTTGFVKHWAFRRFREGSLTQSLVAALPQDRRQWRYGTNRRSMRRANQLAVEFVEATLAHPDSGLPEAMAQVRRYASTRRRREGLTRPQARQLVDRGRERIIERSVNAVYAVLRQLPEQALVVSTPLLEAANVEPVPEWGTPGPGGFLARLRLAGSRLDHHRRRAARFADLAASWRDADERGEASADSRSMVRLYDVECEYHQACSTKYAGLLPLAAQLDPGLSAQVAATNELAEQVVALRTLRADTTIARLAGRSEAEELGQAVYGQEGGWLLAAGDPTSLAEFDRRLRLRIDRHRRGVAQLQEAVSGRGLGLHEAPDGRLWLEPRRAVAALAAVDLHRAKELWGRDLPPAATRTFLAWAGLRDQALQEAQAYLRSSGQAGGLAGLGLGDITVMRQAAAQVVATARVGGLEGSPTPEGEGAARTVPVGAQVRTVPVGAQVRTVPVGAGRPGADLVAAVRTATREVAERGWDEAAGNTRDDPGKPLV